MSPNNSADQVADIRRLKAWSLRAQGKSYREIGAELGVSHVTAWKDVEAYHEAEAETVREETKHHIAMALHRSDRVIAVLLPLAEKGDLEAADRLDKFEKRRASLLGLDAATKQELSGPQGAPIEINARDALVERLAGLIAGETAGAEAQGDSGATKPGGS